MVSVCPSSTRAGSGVSAPTNSAHKATSTDGMAAPRRKRYICYPQAGINEPRRCAKSEIRNVKSVSDFEFRTSSLRMARMSDPKPQAYQNEDLAPTPPEGRKWGVKDLAALWISMSACIPTYMLASSLIAEG